MLSPSSFALAAALLAVTAGAAMAQDNRRSADDRQLRADPCTDHPELARQVRRPRRHPCLPRLEGHRLQLYVYRRSARQSDRWLQARRDLRRSPRRRIRCRSRQARRHQGHGGPRQRLSDPRPRPDRQQSLRPVHRQRHRAYPDTKLYEAWIEHKFADGKIAVRAGQLAADTEFFISQSATLFVNSTFGWPASFATRPAQRRTGLSPGHARRPRQAEADRRHHLARGRLQRRSGRRLPAGHQQPARAAPRRRRDRFPRPGPAAGDRRGAVRLQPGKGRQGPARHRQDRLPAPFRIVRGGRRPRGPDGERSGQRFALRHHRSGDLPRARRKIRPGRRGVPARLRPAQRPQPDRPLCRRRHHLQGTIQEPSGRYGRPQRRLRPYLVGP